MSRFAGKVALVTGASRGLGRHVATALAAEGAFVGALGRDEDALAQTVSLGGSSVFSIVADVRRAGDVERAVSTVVERFSGLDLLVNAAGVLRNGTAVDMSEADWDLIFDTNVKGCFLTTKYAVPAMKERGGGAIVNVSSVFAHAATTGAAAYAASKAAVVALTKTCALDHIGDGIRVNGVAPGSMETPMLVDALRRRAPEGVESLLDATGRLHPLGRLVEPAEITRLILFLLSDEAGAIVGSTYTIDGGRLAQLGTARPSS
jgi:meso-butanediol dehydrogenase/(S,S)-butanediol dehydrogenase/diacetyl reductase